jgi:Terminase large subunit, T4likevirus-type, N-terminal
VPNNPGLTDTYNVAECEWSLGLENALPDLLGKLPAPTSPVRSIQFCLRRIAASCPTRGKATCYANSRAAPTVAGLMGLHRALYNSGSLVLIVSPSQRQSGEIFRTVIGFYHKLTGAPELAAESALRAEFKNGSRIVALPGNEKTIRGYSGANLIILDEASRIEDGLVGGITPMLATTNGSLIALTTPAGKRGWFYDQWISADDWTRVRVNAPECPRISKEFLDEEMRRLGPLVFQQEYDLEFIDNADAMWAGDTIIFEDYPTLFGR